MEREESGGSAGLLQQILSLKLVPRVGNGTLCPNSTSLCSFPAGAGPAGRVAHSSNARKNCPCAESWREERGLHLGRRRKALRGGTVICVDLERQEDWGPCSWKGRWGSQQRGLRSS
ncbi:transmembrane protein 170A isoform X3 [Cebus imitator]|uniref:transmembrane protein 170A isoform X3 n=1 Tax=Cebus imitator TaxID=2715852 RepID=UPI00080A6C55|nr:transmembrane protein 170A isoform X3 [Cebus imitator]